VGDRGDGERERIVPQPFALQLRFRLRRQRNDRELRAAVAYQFMCGFGVDELDVELDISESLGERFEYGRETV
jgi:hypothetical protein